MGNRDSALGRHTKSHVLRGPAQKQQLGRSLGQKRLPITESLPGGTGALWGWRCGGSRLWSSVHRSNTRAGGPISPGTRPPTSCWQHPAPTLLQPRVCSQPWGKPTLPSSRSTATARGMALQPAGPRPSPTYWHPYSCRLHHNRRAHTAHTGGTPRTYSSCDQRRLCCWPHWPSSA